ncbi:MAG: SH3 domain-containing protein [Lawsonibacter sp.]|nr:SH3 domain-containing protein [Lawsonibacter sp.]
MAEKQNPSRRASESRSAADRQATARRDETEKRTSSRRSEVIRCENCGEDYSITYKRCPFCDERPGRGGIGGRRVAGGKGGSYPRPVHPVQVIGLVISLVLIIAALFIVFKYVGPLLFDHKPDGGSASAGTSQSGSQSGSASASQSGSASSSAGSGSTQPDVSTPAVTITSIQLSRMDITLSPNEEYQIIVAVTPADAATQVVWTSSDPSVLSVDEDGIVKNINSGSALVKATITAAGGGQSAECTVYCKPGGASTGGTAGEATGSGSGTSTGSVAPNTPGTIVNADGGLNIRSGPGSSYEVIASASNGAAITVLEDSGNGWYKIDYGGGKTGYVASGFVSAGN